MIHPRGAIGQSDQTLSVVRRVLDAIAAHDLDAFRDLLDADVVLHVGGGPTTIAGIDAVVAAVTVTDPGHPRAADHRALRHRGRVARRR